MKREMANAEIFFNQSKTDPLLKKQLSQIMQLPEKEYAHEAVRLGRMRGLYFSEHDWLHVCPIQPMKKAA